jgi:hypothetical protein
MWAFIFADVFVVGGLAAFDPSNKHGPFRCTVQLKAIIVSIGPTKGLNEFLAKTLTKS